MKILFEGAYTIHSAGDDAALEAMLFLLRAKAGPGRKVEARVLARHPNAQFDRALGVHTLQNLEWPTKTASLGHWLRGFNCGDAPEALLDLMPAFESSDLVVLGAGNFLNENSFGLFRGMLARLCVSAFMARLASTPCLLYGMSASHLASPLARRMAQWLLDNVSVVTFREDASIRLLQKLGIRIPAGTEVLPDPVVCSSCARPHCVRDVLAGEGIPVPGSGRRLAVSVREFRHRGETAHRDFMARMARILDMWTSAGGEVLFIPHCTYDVDGSFTDDRHWAGELKQGMKHPERAWSIRGRYWPWETEGLYGCCDAALCTRLHAGVFACKQGVPAVALAYEPKVEGFWESMGLAEYALPLDSAPGRVLTALRNACAAFARPRVRTRLAGLRCRAERYADIALRLCSEQKGDRRADAPPRRVVRRQGRG